jgi:thiol-disulfide isomerase/thioredoxin
MKKFKSFLFVAVLFVYSISIAQINDSISITGRLIGNAQYAKVVLKKFEIGLKDYAEVPINMEVFNFKLPPTIQVGIYRFQYSQSNENGYVDIIIDGKEKVINFEFVVSNPSESLVFIKSEENRKWYSYLKESQSQIQKISVLQQFIPAYPNSTDTIVKQIHTAIDAEKLIYTTNFIKFTTENATSLSGIMIKNNPFYFVNPKDDVKIQDYERKEHYWDLINTNETELINTPLYTNHILNYLSYYMNPKMHFDENEMNSGFIKSVDIILDKFGNNEVMKQFALKYLQLGFKEIGNEKVLQYLDLKYQKLLEQCSNSTIEKSDYESRLEGYNKIKRGSLAPNIIWIDNQNKVQELYKIKSPIIILVFWASWCPHCMEIMPKLNEWVKSNKNSKVLAISLDDDKVLYKQTIKNFTNLIHHCDFKKWEGSAVRDYKVLATPTFVALDDDKKIINKFDTFDELVRYFENLKSKK